MTTLLAALLMVIDHAGIILFPEIVCLRWIGRLSFPLFAYGIARGVEHTSNFWNYLMRILIAAILSQPIYMFILGSTGGNPLFTLAYGALMLYLWQKEETAKRVAGWALLLLATVMPFSYGWYGVWTIFVFQFYKERKKECFFLQVALQVFYVLNGGTSAQALSLLSFGIIDWIGDKRVSLPRYFFYAFYPLHLLLLYGCLPLRYR